MKKIRKGPNSFSVSQSANDRRCSFQGIESPRGVPVVETLDGRSAGERGQSAGMNSRRGRNRA